MANPLYQGLLGPVGQNSGLFGMDPQTSGLVAAARALGQQSGPSRMPQGTGSMMANALAAGAGGYRQAQLAGLNQQMNKMKFDAAKRAQAVAGQQAIYLQELATAQATGDPELIRAATARAYPGKAADLVLAKPNYKQRKIPVKAPGTGYMYQSQESNDGGRTWVNLGPAAPASASTNVSVSMGKTAGEGLLKNWQGIVDNGMQAQTNLGTVNQMQALLEGGVNTGFAQPMMLDIQRAYQRIDPNYKIESVAGGEAFAGLSNKIILPLVKQLGVNPTDKDLDFIVKGSPELAKSPAGNRLMLKALEVSQNRQIRMSQLATQWMQKNAPAIEGGTLSPLMAQIEFRKYLQNATVNDPEFKQAADDMKMAYAAVVGGSLTESSAQNAAKAGGYVN
jgi:hypothetical protein